jgi:hypothetical protein
MSRAYKIRVSQSDTRVIHADDAVSTQLGILDILPQEEMAKLLADELRKRGFTDDGKLLRRDRDGVRVAIDPSEGVITVRSESCDEVEVESTREGVGYDDIGPAHRNIKERLTQQANEDLDRIAANEQRKLQQKATENLEGHLIDLKKELDQAVNRVTAEALKRKAAQLGQIREIQEDPEAGSLTIKVEV